MMIGFLILVLILFFVFRRPYGTYHVRDCCMPGYGMRGENQTQSEKNNARAILDERYVKGELTDEEYKTKKANLG